MQSITQDFFIAPGVNLTDQSPDLATAINISKEQLKKRWRSQQGSYILTHWKANGFKRAIIDEQIGRYKGHTDLRGIPFKGEKIENVDLKNVDFFAADMQEAEFNNVDFTDSWLSHCNIRKAQFKWSKMDKVILDDVEYDHRTSFVGIDLNTINFTFATILRDNALTEQRISHLQRANPVLSWVLKYTCDYGRSIFRFIASCFALIGIFTFGFYFVPGTLSSSGFYESLYFSTATFVKVSPRDIYTVSFIGNLLFLFEAAIAYAMLSILVAIIIRKTIGR